MKQFFTLRRGGRSLIIRAAHIATMQAFGSYTEIYLLDGSSIRVSKNLKYLLSHFTECDFLVRAHRSWVINVDLVSRLLPGRPCSVLLKNGLRIPLGAGVCEQIANQLGLRPQSGSNTLTPAALDNTFHSSLSGADWNYLSGDTMALDYTGSVALRGFSYTYALPQK